MSNPALADYLFAGELLRARLAAQLPDIPVGMVDEMAQVVEDQDLRAAVLYVLWSGDNVADSLSHGPTTLRQEWTVWVRVLNAGQTAGNARARDAGPLLARVHLAVAGWKPEGLHRPFTRANGPRPNYRPISGMYPLTFQINLPL